MRKILNNLKYNFNFNVEQLILKNNINDFFLPNNDRKNNLIKRNEFILV